MDELLFEACTVAERYKYDRVELEHVIFVLLSRPDLQETDGQTAAIHDEISMTLDSGFRFWRKRNGVQFPRLIISDQVMRALERSEAEHAPLLPYLLSEMGQEPSSVNSPDSFEGSLPDLDELLDEIEREKAAFGFDRMCDDVFSEQERSDATGQRAFSPDRKEGGADLKSEQRAFAETSAQPDTKTSPETPKTAEKSSLSSKERLEAKRAVERSIRDLTALYLSGELDPVIGRDREIDEVCRVLMRRRKSNVLLVGEPGVGKTALMEGVAAHVARSGDPALSSRPVLQASLGALVSGARYRGDFEIRMELLIEHAIGRNAILFFDEMQMLVGAGATAERGMDGANLLKPALARDGMSLVGATTHEEAASIRADPALMRRFEQIVVNEPDEDLMRSILPEASGPYLAHHGVKADGRVLDRLVDFADRYMPDRRFPDKAFDLLDASCVLARVSGQTSLKVEHIRNAVRQLGGTLPAPSSSGSDERRDVLDRMSHRLSKRVGGHPDAVREISKLVWAGDLNRPVIAQLAGPEGIGRRTLARELARLLAEPLCELDMAAGPEQVRQSIQSNVRPGTRSVFLLNVPHDQNLVCEGFLKEILSSGEMTSETGKRVSLNGVVILVRADSERSVIGFGKTEHDTLMDMTGIERIRLHPFEGDRLALAVRFELERLSRIWSDSGVSRPVPSLETILYEVQGPISRWSDIVRVCQEIVLRE